VCPACAWSEKMERIYLELLLQHLLSEDGLRDPYEKSEGLCLPHFRQALALVRDEQVFDALLGAQRAVWAGLVAELGEFIRKSDHRFRHEPMGPEKDAWIRSIAALVGARPERRRS